MPRPVLERTVVQEGFVAEGPRGEDNGGCLLADVAVGDDGVARFDPRLREEGIELGRGAKLKVVSISPMGPERMRRTMRK